MKNEVFVAYTTYSLIVVVKMMSMSLMTTYFRMTRGVSTDGIHLKVSLKSFHKYADKRCNHFFPQLYFFEALHSRWCKDARNEERW